MIPKKIIKTQDKDSRFQPKKLVTNFLGINNVKNAVCRKRVQKKPDIYPSHRHFKYIDHERLSFE